VFEIMDSRFRGNDKIVYALDFLRLHHNSAIRIKIKSTCRFIQLEFSGFLFASRFSYPHKDPVYLQIYTAINFRIST